MKKKTQILSLENGLLVDLTFHSVPASLLSEFTEKIVRPYYEGNMNVANPRPTPQNPYRTRLHPIPHNSHQKR